MKKAVIVGCQGQDGRLLNDLLTRKKYRIVGLDKRIIKYPRRSHFKKVDISKRAEVFDLIKLFKPDEVYYLAAFHHSSEDRPIENIKLFQESYKVNVLSLINFLEGIRMYSPRTRLFYAASSHVFGESKDIPQDESTHINPNCIYGITKAAGLFTCRFYRNNYSLFASAGILYNHESSLRNERFVSMKIIKTAVNINKNKEKHLNLGDLSAEADFGYAPDYVDAMYRILNIDKSDDFVIASGEKHSVRNFVKTAFEILELDWKRYVREDRNIVTKRNLCRFGNPDKLKRMTGWKSSVSFEGMIRLLLSEEEALSE